ncbi:MAG: FKBP-type peptidyl-prolyl cis-trans isomerase [Bacteroidales bacterium]|nr:FKBP-type peptidyl-prolyl cis-trans isomerase [Bacteroidales bacterium]
MKKYLILFLCLTLATPYVFAKKAKKEEVKKEQKQAKKQTKKSPKGEEVAPQEEKCCKLSLVTLQDSIAYAYGMAMGKQTVGMLEQMKNDVGFDLSSEIILASWLTQLEKDSTKMLFTDAQLADIYAKTNNIVRSAAQKKKEAEVLKNKEEGAKFLAEKEKEEGVVKTESGLLYKVEKMGEGAKPDINSLVQVHYSGKLIDGTEFDSSYKRGKPADFSLNGLIKGWQEGICLMPVGSKFTFYIPYELGYGEYGQGPIPPASVLIFEVELLEMTSNN